MQGDPDARSYRPDAATICGRWPLAGRSCDPCDPRNEVWSVLAHTVGDETERAYQRGDLLDKRRRLMDQWSAFCRSKPRSEESKLRPTGITISFI
jgi:hypothetical protein